MGSLPTGQVTFAFVDVVGSTRAFQHDPDYYLAAVQRVHAEVALCVGRHAGTVVKTEGDGAFLAFEDADAAVSALTALQVLRSEDGDPLALSVRVGAHRGHAVPVDGDYLALPVHVAARVVAAAGAGQVIVSDTVAAAVKVRVGWHDFGERLLRDIARPMRLWLAAGPRDEPRVPTPQRTNVPVSITSYIAGEELLAELSDQLSLPGFVTLVGPGGLGKTRAASELALRQVGSFARGTWLVQLSALGPSDSVEQAIAAVLGVTAPNGDLRDAICTHIAEQGSMLLVLDNCEHVLEPVADVVGALLASAPELRVLCTSRESLGLAGEHVVRPRPLGTESAAGEVSAAAVLFRERATSVGWIEGEEDEAWIEQICAALDGLPLGIEIAASAAGVMPLAALASSVTDLGETARLLRRRGGDPRQRTLTDLVSWSDQLLSRSERNALRVLSALPGGFTADAAQVVLTEAARHGVDVRPTDMWGLTRRSLLDVDGHRLRMLHSIRLIAQEWLHEQPALHSAAEAALLAWAAAWCAPLQEMPPNETRGPVMGELPNLLAAIRIGVSRESHEVGGTLSIVTETLTTSGIPPDLREAALRTLSWPTPQTADGVLVRLNVLKMLNGLGVGTVAWLSQSELLDLVTTADASRDDRLRARARLIVSTALPLPEQSERARQMTHEALKICRNQARLRNLLGPLHGNLGYIEHLDGHLEEALGWYDEAARLSLETGTTDNVVSNLLNRGEALLDLQRPAEALASIQEGLVHITAQRTLRWLATGLTGEAFTDLGQREEASSWLERASLEEDDRLATDPTLRYYADRFKAASDRANAG